MEFDEAKKTQDLGLLQLSLATVRKNLRMNHHEREEAMVKEKVPISLLTWASPNQNLGFPGT